MRFERSKAVLALWTASVFTATDAFAASDEKSSAAVTVIVLSAVLIGVVTAFALYKAAHVQKKLDIDVLDVKKLEVDTSSVPSDIRDKVKKLPIKMENPEETVQQISKIVEDET